MEGATVHVHVEKTAGVKVKEAYKQVYGPENVWVLSMDEGVYRPADTAFFNPNSVFQQDVKHFLFRNMPTVAAIGQQILNHDPRRKALPLEQASETAQVITGHITFDDVSRVLDPQNTEYRTVLRHPYERMRSHYDHLRTLSGSKPRHRVHVDNIDELSFEEFAFLEPLKNYQARAIGPDLGAYSAVGVTEHLDAFLEVCELPADPVIVNAGQRNTDTALSGQLMTSFEDFHRQDYEMYYKALSAWR